MTTHHPSINALNILSNRFAKNKIIHALGGSGLLFALSLIDEVRDWDITTEASLETVTELLKDLEWRLIPASELFKSHFLIKVTFENTEIDIIGNFNIKKDDGTIHNVPVKIYKYWNGIPLADPYEWMIAYELMKRESKAEKLKAYLISPKPTFLIS